MREGAAVLLDVRAGDVGLDRRDARARDQFGRQVGEALDRGRRDADHQRRRQRAMLGSVCSRKYGTPLDGMPIALIMPVLRSRPPAAADCRRAVRG